MASTIVYSSEELFDILEQNFEEAYNFDMEAILVSDTANSDCDVCGIRERHVMDLAFFHDFRLCSQCYENNDIIKHLLDVKIFLKDLKKVETNSSKFRILRSDLLKTVFAPIREEKEKTIFQQNYDAQQTN